MALAARGIAARAGLIGAAALVMAAGFPASPAHARHRFCRRCFLVEPFFDTVPPVQGPIPNYPYGAPPEPGLPGGPALGGASPRPTSPSLPYSEGFVLTYTVRHEQQTRGIGPLQRYADVGKALAGCWSSSDITKGDWHDVTLRLSFKRDGSVNGVPRIQHLTAPGDADSVSRLRTGILSTLDQCTPLPVSPALGAAIAGQIFAIRFIQAKDT